MSADRRQAPDRRRELRPYAPGRRDHDDVALWISVRRYCETYQLSRATVYKYVEMGLLAKWQVGRTLRVKNEPPMEKR